MYAQTCACLFVSFPLKLHVCWCILCQYNAVELYLMGCHTSSAKAYSRGNFEQESFVWKRTKQPGCKLRKTAPSYCASFCTNPVTISGHPFSYYRHEFDVPAITMISLKCGKSTLGNRILGSGLNVLIQWRIRNSTGRVGYRFHQTQNCIKEMIKCLNISTFL